LNAPRRRRVGLVAVLAGGVLAAGATGAPAVPQTTSVLEIDNALTGVGGFDPQGRTLPAPGQGISFSGALYRWAGSARGARIGSVQAICMRTTGPDAICSAVLSLTGGTLELLGPTNFASAAPSDIAIVGGTGRYAGSSGWMHSVPVGGRSLARFADTLRLTD